MITIVKAKIKNYRSIGEIEINIDGEGLVSVLGANLDDPLSPSNGVGKSTILSAFKWGLFGVSTDGDKADDILSWTNPKDCSVEMTVIKDAQVAEIARYRKHKQHSNNVYFYIDKQPVNAAKNKDIQPLIDAFLGFDENIFSILLTMGSLSKNAEPFLYMNDSGRKEFTDFLLNLSYLGDCLKEVKIDIDIKENEISTVVNDIAKINIQQESLKTKLEEYKIQSDTWETSHAANLKDYKEAVAKTAKLVEISKDDLIRAERALDKAKQDKEAADTRSTELSVAIFTKKRDADEIDKALHAKQDEINDCIKQRINVPQYPEPTGECTDYDREIAELNADYDECDKQVGILEAKKEHLEKNKLALTINFTSQDVTDKISEITTKINDIAIKTGVFQAEKDHIRRDHAEVKEFLASNNLKCPKCRQAVNKEHLEAEMESLKQAHNTKIDEIKKFSEEAEQLQKEKDQIIIKNVADNTAKFENELNEIKNKINTFVDRVNSVHDSLVELRDKKAKATEKLKEVQTAENLRAEKERLATLAAKLDTLSAEHGALTAAKIKAESDYQNALFESQNYKDAIACYIEAVELIEKNVKTLITASANLESALKYHKKQLEDEQKRTNPYTDVINKNVLMYNEQSAIIKDNSAKLATLRQDIEYLYFWKEGFNTAGLKSYILDSVTALLDTKANDCLSKLSSSLAVKFVTQDILKSGDIRDKFDVNIYNNGNKTQFYRLSAGQKARVSFAVNYALKILAEYYHNIKINFTFIDEALDNLDSVGIQQVIHTLREQLQQYTSIFVVSHNDELKSLFDKTLLLLYENGVTRLDD